MGAKPPTEIWARKAESLKNRVGGLYEFLDKTKFDFKIFTI